MKFFVYLFIYLFVLSVQAQERKSTASANVEVLEKQFKIPGLDRSRGIRVYLPPSYDQSDQRYPVIYMHDGQNLFDDATSFVGEWGVDEVLNEVAFEGGPEFIVVGVDNGGTLRTEELTPWPHPKFEGGKGGAYVKFIVETIKPFIDAEYRTKPDAENTAIGGSSLGGLISHYAIYKYPDTFSKAIIYSPSYWFSFDEVMQFTDDHPLPPSHKIDLLVGKKEGEDMYEPLDLMARKISAMNHSISNMRVTIDEDGEHNEKFWRSQFKASVLWLFQ